MPYIDANRRLQLDKYPFQAKKAGELNYVLCHIIWNYLEQKTVDKIGEIPNIEKLKYKDYNEIIGILESCKLEIYRRLISSYEDKKKDENGDVFE